MTTSDTATENGILIGRAQVALKPRTHYYWRVRRTVSDPGLSCWRPLQEFTTADKRPTALSPIRQKFYPWGLPFKWSSVPNATSYTLEVVTDSNFAPDSQIFAPVEADTTETILSVKVKSQLFWHVRANFAGDDQGEALYGRWSKAAQFNTSIPRVKLISPIAAAVGPWPVVFKWEKNRAADHYLLEVTGGKFDPASPGYRQFEERPHPHIPGPAHDSLNFDVSNPPPGTTLIPMVWRVRVFGPPPLGEEGIPEERHFQIDAKKTLVEQLEPQGAYCARSTRNSRSSGSG